MSDPSAIDLARRLGSLLAALRQERKLTQEQVAEAAGISRNHLQLLESGLSNRSGAPANPRLSTLIALAQVLGTDVPTVVRSVFNAADSHVPERLEPTIAVWSKELFSQ
ncbi:anaerobic benzoate catabolism transcriptional regulator [Mycobacteroides abscessus]|nr:anaerobic benzoate catabolism transcriptional regulator [Mycobacteroides abscessus]CRG61213.1 anaerobic benzoate catabolism transcriptional regulator [Mycobacteroides abscessus]